jgi:hypothetical protein
MRAAAMGRENVGSVLARSRTDGVSIAALLVAGAGTTDDPTSDLDFLTHRQALQKASNKKGIDATSLLMRS